MNYIIATHMAYSEDGREVYGPVHEISNYLRSGQENSMLIKHCLYGFFKSRVDNNIGIGMRSKEKLNIFLRTIYQINFNIKEAYNFSKKNPNQKIIFIGIDPINSVSGFILKKMKIVNKNIYYTVDYADNRFNNLLLNLVYHFMDRISLLGADEVWCVSTRIISKRKIQRVPNKKLKFLPNSPFASDIPKTMGRRDKNLIIVSNLTKSVYLEPTLKLVKTLVIKHKELKLLIVGTGPQSDKFKTMVNKIGLKNKVVFLGQKTHKEVLKLMSKSFLGLALYTEENNWNFYGDSMKTREYVACGLPVITNNVSSTSDDIKRYKAGFVVDKIDEKEVIVFIEKCINDIDYYNYLSNNAKRMGVEFDKDKILGQLMK